MLTFYTYVCGVVYREGVRDLDELRERYRERIEKVKREEAVVAGAETIAAPPPPPPPAPSSPQTQQQQEQKTNPPGIKPLSSILDLPKISPLPPDTISELWRLHHATIPNTLSASIPLSTFTTMTALAQQHPSFILPLPRPSPDSPTSPPLEIHFLQWNFPTPQHPTLLLTSLADYKLHGEYATPHTTLTHYLDLAASKDLVLLRGDVMPDRGVSVDDARWLVMCLQKFYGPQGEVDGGRRRGLLEAFTRGDEGFRVEDVVGEVERID
jgi:ATP synthase mitochondrial F1 complex assembly factor 1